MSGSNEHNNRDALEQFFQKKSGEYHIPYREEDWLKLEKRLAERDADRYYRRRLTWVAAAVFLFVVLMGYFTYSNYVRINELNRRLHHEMVDETDRGRFIEQIFPDYGLSLQEDRNFVMVPDDYQRPEGDHPASAPDKEGLQVADGVAPESDRDAVFPVAEDPSIPDSPATEWRERVPRIRITPHVVAGELSRLQGKIASVDPHRVADDRGGAPSPAPIEDPADGDTDGIFVMREPDSQESRLGVGFIMAPDISSAGRFESFHKPGFKIGMHAEYRLSEKLSISVGMIHSRVHYSAGASGYDPPNYWARGMSPDNITAECAIIDIPVQLQYTIHSREHSRFYASGGISSYIMLSEEYLFSYENNTYEQPEQWSDRTGTRHWLSNVGVSAGYERDINRHWSVRVEPFLRLPLRDIGWANVRLYSFGSFLSLNYRF